MSEAWIPARIAAIRDLTTSIRELTIIADHPLPAPPGSHIRVRLSADGRDDHRAYSVTAQAPGRVRIAVKRQPASRGGSAHMWSLAPGDALEIVPPKCDFPLAGGVSRYLLIAGGVGVTPLLTMAGRLATNGASLRMVYAAHTRYDFAYRDELAAMLGDRLALFASDAGERIDITGEIDRLPPDAELYMCGPLRLMDAVRHAWAQAGRPMAKLRYETFGSSGRFAAQAFMVDVPRLGKRVVVRETETMLDALEAAGVAVVSECRRGECGLCAIDIVAADGEIDHRDVFFSDRQHAANTRMCACVSRVARGSVTIDPAWRGDDAFRSD